MNLCGAGPCLLCQEYATLKAYGYGAGQPIDTTTTTVVMQPSPQGMYQAMPQQPTVVMYNTL